MTNKAEKPEATADQAEPVDALVMLRSVRKARDGVQLMIDAGVFENNALDAAVAKSVIDSLDDAINAA